MWSQWCLSGHYNYDKSCAVNTAQPVSLHLTVKALSKCFWQIQYTTQETYSSNNCGRLAVTHAKQNAKTSTKNTVSHFTTNDKYQMTSEHHHEKSAVLRLSILLFPSFETPLHFSFITSTYVQYCNFCSKHGSYLAICLRNRSHKKTVQIKHLPFTVPKEYTSFCLPLLPNCESVWLSYQSPINTNMTYNFVFWNLATSHIEAELQKPKLHKNQVIFVPQHSQFIYGTETDSLLMRIQNVSAWWSLTIPHIKAAETEGGHVHRSRKWS